MVGIVIVSHSAKLAEGVVEIASQMAEAECRIEAAGGLEDGSIGTDATRILRAIQAVDSGDGVVVLADLGSAILSTETALDFLSGEERNRVRIADAPVAEGAVGAAVSASAGLSLAEVAESAEEARSMHKT